MEEKQLIKFEIDDKRLELVGSHVHVITKLVKMYMKEGNDFGIIPGTKKPTLLKAGAEKIALLCNAGATYHWTTKYLENDHREFEVMCEWFHRETSQKIGQGLGSSSTLETKYKHAKHPADVYNTCLKMAKKRAFVDTAISTGACGDLFTQDVEDMEGEISKVVETKPSCAPVNVSSDDFYEVKCDYKTGQLIKDDLKKAGYRWDGQNKVWLGDVLVESAIPYTYCDGKLITETKLDKKIDLTTDEIPF